MGNAEILRDVTSKETPILDAEVTTIKVKRPNASQDNVQKIVKRITENGDVNLTALTEEEKNKYEKINKGLVMTDINSISNYGADLSNTMTRYSNDFLKAVRVNKSGEVGLLINNLLNELGYIDIDELKEPNMFKKIMRRIPILKKMVMSVDKIFNKYDSISKNVDDISKKITATRLTSLRDNNALNVMFDNNVQYIKQIEDVIVAGKIKLSEVDSKLNEMLASANEYDAHVIQDVQEFRNNLDKRLNDMITLRYVMKQSLPQIRTVQYNNLAIADKAQSIIATTIPVWRNQLSIAVALHNQKANIEAHRRVTETTNEILRKNAEMLRQNSVEVAKENERSVVDIDTLKHTTEQLIQTVREVKQIHEEGAANRKRAEEEILKIEKELESSMTSMAQNAYSSRYID